MEVQKCRYFLRITECIHDRCRSNLCDSCCAKFRRAWHLVLANETFCHCYCRLLGDIVHLGYGSMACSHIRIGLPITESVIHYHFKHVREIHSIPAPGTEIVHEFSVSLLGIWTTSLGT